VGCTARACKHKNIYVEDDSSTYVVNGTEFNIAYGSGPVSGYWSEETITWAGMSAPGMLFAEITDPSGLGAAYAMGKFDGILGMAWQSISVESAPTAYEVIMKNGDVTVPQFAFSLGADGADGELMLGGYDKDMYTGDILWVPLSHETYWQFDVEKITFGSNFTSSANSAIVDTGTSVLAGPVLEVQAMMEQIGAQPYMGGVEYMVDCSDISSLPDLSINIAGVSDNVPDTVTYTLTPDEYTINAGNGLCMVAILGMDTAQNAEDFFWILGDTFIRKYYSIFDLDKEAVGLATHV
jgi:hypothetical protein